MRERERLDLKVYCICQWPGNLFSLDYSHLSLKLSVSHTQANTPVAIDFRIRYC